MNDRRTAIRQGVYRHGYIQRLAVRAKKLKDIGRLTKIKSLNETICATLTATELNGNCKVMREISIGRRRLDICAINTDMTVLMNIELKTTNRPDGISTSEYINQVKDTHYSMTRYIKRSRPMPKYRDRTIKVISIVVILKYANKNKRFTRINDSSRLISSSIHPVTTYCHSILRLYERGSGNSRRRRR